MRCSVTLATAVAALFLVGIGVEQAAARDRGGAPSAGGGGGGGGSGRSFGGGGGGRSFGGGGGSARTFSGGGRSFDGGRSGRYTGGDRGPRFAAPRDGVRSFGRSGQRVYSYARPGRHSHHRHRRRNGVIVYGLPFYGAYAYGSCSYYYDRAITTGSPYWWDRYYECTGSYW